MRFRHLAALLVLLSGAFILVHKAQALGFEKVGAYSDWTFDNAAAVVFFSDSDVGVYRDGRLWKIDLNRPVRGPDNTDVINWDFLDDWTSGRARGEIGNTYPVLVWYDRESQHFLIYHGLAGENGSRYWWFDVQSSAGEDGYWYSPMRLTRASDFKRINTNFPEVLVFQKGVPDRPKGSDPLISLEIKWRRAGQATTTIAFRARGDASKIGTKSIPLDHLEWTKENQFVFSDMFTAALSFVDNQQRDRDAKIKPIPGVFVFGVNSTTRYPEIAPDVVDAKGNYLRVFGTWGRKLLIVDGSPFLDVVRKSPEEYLENTGTFQADVANKPVVNYFRDGESDVSSSAQVGTAYWEFGRTLRYRQESLPFRVVVYDPDAESVSDSGLPYYHLFSYYPFAVNPKGNLLAFAAKDPATGLFKEWGIYRIVLDAQINDDKVRYRDAPKTTGRILGTLDKGMKVKLLDRTNIMEKIGDTQEYWYKVRLQNGNEAWVFGAFITKLD